MNYTKSNKRKLLQGASALILGSISVAAVAETVTTTTSTVAPSGVDALLVKNQENDGGATANANGADYYAVSDGAVTNSSVNVDNNGSEAIAKGNTETATVTDTVAAEIYTTKAISLDQDTSGVVTATANSTNTFATGSDISGSTIKVFDNNNLALAQGNNGATSTTLTGYATNSTEAVIGALQNNSRAGLSGDTIRATAYNNQAYLQLGTEVDGSRGAITGNTDRTSATGNNLTQQMTLGGTSLNLSNVSASADTTPTAGSSGSTGTADVNASGAAVISSSQINTNAVVRAETDGSRMKINAPVSIDGSVLELSSNVQDATAMGSAVGNTMTLNGETVGTGAAIVSSQSNDANSNVIALTTAEARIGTGAIGGDTGSTIRMTDNKIQSRATGGSVSNTMAVSATTVTLQAQDGTDAVTIDRIGGESSGDTSLSGAVSGAFVTLNDQLIKGDVTATTQGIGGTGPGFLVFSAGTVTGSTINNDFNTLSAQAQAAVATNSTTLTVGGALTELGNTGADGDTVANGAAIANIQEVTDSVNVFAGVQAGGAATVELLSGLIGSTSTASSNKVQAFAEGATSTNALTVSATTLNVADGSTGDATTSVSIDFITADTAFAVTNVQNGGTGSVMAVLEDSAMISTRVNSNVDGSKVTSAGNMQDAFASSNKSTNSLSLSATTLSGDAGLANSQTSASDVRAFIGGADGEGFIPGAVGANVGAIVTVNQNVIDSTIAVTGNMVRGSAISNSGTNSLTVAATTLSGDGNVKQAVASAGEGTYNAADYSLGSVQVTLADASSETAIASTFGIDQAFDKLLSGSSLSVSNNTQFGEALANTVTNRVSVASTDVGAVGTVPTTALNNFQYVGSATIDSGSDMEIFTNAASDGSSIALNGNSNTALGVANNASNIMSVTGVTVDGTVSDGDAYANRSGTQVIADFAINNTQQSSGVEGAVNSTALTTIYNADINDGFVGGTGGTEASAGLLNSSVTMSNNVTTAEASSNRALNSLSVSATNSAATAAVGNFQDSNNAVNAVASSETASTSIAMELDVRGATGDFGRNYAASGSTVTMANNSTTALARGNSASNTLNYTVSASYDGVTTDAVNGGNNIAAAAVVFNAQENSGAINAEANSVNYSIELNDGASGLAYGPINSSISMTGNAVNAVAFGNTATNNLTMSTFGAGIPSSINANIQFNSGNVTATATLANMGVSSARAVQGSAIRNSGNSASASAIGNNSVSTISGGN